MQKKIKIYHLGNKDINYSKWVKNRVIVDNMEEADIVWGSGGEDVSPALYGEPIHSKTYTNELRDAFEFHEWQRAIRLNKKLVGTCRSAQMLCVVAGGKLVQHQENPSYYHNINTYDNKIIEVTSTHHQSQLPFNLSEDKYRILGWTNNISKFHEDGNHKELNPSKECEIVFYSKINALALQPHPEIMDRNHPTLDYLRDLLDKFLNNNL